MDCQTLATSVRHQLKLGLRVPSSSSLLYRLISIGTWNMTFPSEQNAVLESHLEYGSRDIICQRYAFRLGANAVYCAAVALQLLGKRFYYSHKMIMTVLCLIDLLSFPFSLCIFFFFFLVLGRFQPVVETTIRTGLCLACMVSND